MLRGAARHRVPVVPQGARTGLSGAANAVDGALMLSLTRMDRILEIDPVDRVAVVEPGVVNAELSRAVAERRALLPAGPVARGSSSTHRRQRRHQRRRHVLRQVRRHRRVRARPGGRARRRRGAARRPPDRQGRRRLRPDPAVRRLGGHARRDHRGDAGAAARRRSRRSPWRRSSPTAAAGDRGRRDHGRRACARRCWSCWTAPPPGDRGVPRHGPARGRRGDAASPRSDTRPRWRPPTSPRSGGMCQAAGADRGAVAEDAAEAGDALAARRLARPAVERARRHAGRRRRASRGPAGAALLRRGGADRGGARRDHRRRRRTPATATCTRPWSSTARDPDSRGTGAARRSTRSWSWRWSSVAPSPASTAWACSSGPGCATELGETSYVLQQSIKAVFDPLGILNPGKVL